MLGTDISERMLARASRKAKGLGLEGALEIADVQALPYDDNRFDVVIGTFLFCSVPDPVLGLRDVLRVLKPGGRLLLVEHLMSTNPVLRLLLRLLNPIFYFLWGAHLDRDTAGNARRAGSANLRGHETLAGCRPAHRSDQIDGLRIIWRQRANLLRVASRTPLMELGTSPCLSLLAASDSGICHAIRARSSQCRRPTLGGLQKERA